MVGSEQKFNLSEIARPASVYTRKVCTLNKVLELFKKNKNKFGVVVNEYGSTEGIITLHDLTESIFGDILEEDETEEEEIVHKAGRFDVGRGFNEYWRFYGRDGNTHRMTI